MPTATTAVLDVFLDLEGLQRLEGVTVFALGLGLLYLIPEVPSGVRAHTHGLLCI